MKRASAAVAAFLVAGAAGIPLTAACSQAMAQQSAISAKASRTTTFLIENMTCALCPVTIRKAMQGVKGVKSVRTDLAGRTATVVFDPGKTNAAAIAAASANAGYPAAIKTAAR